jgi:large subunit ribosomal protein L10
MPTDAKRQAVTDLADLLRESSALAVADYRGLTVSEMHTVRRSLRSNGVSLKVAKNRLLKIAADEAGLADLKPLLDGPTAIASTTGDEVSLARALQDAFRPYKVVTLRGGLLAGQPVSAADLQRLATLPSREVLLGRLVGGMAAPLSGMAAVLAANLRNLVGVLSAVADQKRQSEGPSAETADAVATEPAPAEEAAATEETGADAAGSETAPTTEDVAAADEAAAADESDSSAGDAPVEAESADEAAPAEAIAETGEADSAEESPAADEAGAPAEEPAAGAATDAVTATDDESEPLEPDQETEATTDKENE